MNLFSTTLMADKKANCQKEDAEILLLGAKPVNMDDYPKVKYVFRAGIGSDSIPIEQIQERGIKLFFPSAKSRDVISDAVARLAVGYILHAATIDRSIEEWYREPRIGNPKVLVYGCGHVGSRVEKMCQDLGLCVKRYDAKEGYVEPALYHYDIISFHVPLMAYEHGSVHMDNRHLINSKFLDKCKSGAALINTSRGGIANEADIAEWLSCNPRGKYLSDCFETEPYTPDCPLHPYQGKQCRFTPHIASYTQEVRGCLTDDVNAIIGHLS